MKKLFYIMLAVVCLTACKPGVPGNVLKPAQMEKILFDMHIADGYLSTLPVQDSSKAVAASYYNGIYKKFNIDSASYNRSLDYYYKHPDQFSKIYEKVLIKLQDVEDKLRKADKKKK